MMGREYETIFLLSLNASRLYKQGILFIKMIVARIKPKMHVTTHAQTTPINRYPSKNAAKIDMNLNMGINTCSTIILYFTSFAPCREDNTIIIRVTIGMIKAITRSTEAKLIL
jgi:hypothetical protein